MISTVSQGFSENARLPKRKDWKWGIYPITALLRCFGIGLNYGTNSGIKLVLWTVFDVGLLLFNCGGQVGYVCWTLDNLGETADAFINKSVYKSITTRWIMAADSCNYGMHSAILHFLLFVVVRRRWKCLSESFSCSNDFLEEALSIRIRRFSVFGVFLAILDIGAIACNYLVLYDLQYSALKITIGFMVFGLIYQTLAVWLYAVACFTASSFYEAVRREFQTWLDLPRDAQKIGKLRLIKNHHIVACEAVDAINYCFGWSLLFNSSFLVISYITYVFYVVGHDVKIFDQITLFIHNVIYVMILCYSSDNIRNKADELLRELVQSQLDPQDPAINLVHDLIHDMVQSKPRISAAGYFVINKKMIPKMVGTILTYFFILYQFHESEKGNKS